MLQNTSSALPFRPASTLRRSHQLHVFYPVHVMNTFVSVRLFSPVVLPLCPSSTPRCSKSCSLEIPRAVYRPVLVSSYSDYPRRKPSSSTPPAFSSHFPTSNVPKSPFLALAEICQDIYQLSRPLWIGPRRSTALLWVIATVLLALAATLYAVLLSNVKKFFWNVISQKDIANFGKLLTLYALTVTLGPIVLSLFDWVKGRLSLLWRRALTEQLLGSYFSNLNYYKLSQGMGRIDNPDQRIAEDVHKFTSRAVRFFTVMGLAIFDFSIFSVVLYRIFSPLWYVLIVYATLGTLGTCIVGSKLLDLNRLQATKEANFRFGLVRVREATESIAFYGGEVSERGELMKRFCAAFANNVDLIAKRRDVMLVSKSFSYWAQVLPTAVIAPQFFAGKILMGTISQVFFSFNHVLGSVGLVVSEFAELAEFGAGVKRLKDMADFMERREGRVGIVMSTIEGSGVDIKGLTVETPNWPRRVLVKDLNVSVSGGKALLVMGRSGLGKSSLMRAICGLWDHGTGAVSRPPAEDTLFLPQRPFVMLGTLRENVVYPSSRTNITDDEIEDALRRVNLEYLLYRDEGLLSKGETLTGRLSLGEQQRLGFARIVISKPKFVVLDESSSALDLENERDMYAMVKQLGATIISVGNRSSLVDMHDIVLRLEEDGMWQEDIPDRASQTQIDRSQI